MSIFHHFQNLQLTDDQRSALEKVEAFLSSDGSIFMLKGYAGTGKTTLLQGICSYLAGRRCDFRLMAPTGRAAMILSQKTGEQASTIHRGIYNMNDLLEKQDGSSFKYYYKLKINQDSTRCVYLVDEASMVSDVFSDDEFFTFGSGCLLQDLMSYALVGDANRKIIFIGDDAQLPPVDMKFSPALDADYIAEEYKLPSQAATLSQVVRQREESGILDTATKVRNAIAANVFNDFEINYGRGDAHKILPEAFPERYVEVAKQSGTQQTIVITHSNRQALEYNRQIRQLRYGERYSQVQQGDLLIITRNNYNGPVELFNGMFARVLEVGGICYEAHPRFTIEGGKTIQRKLVFRDVRVEVNSPQGGLCQLRTTLLDNFLTTEEGRLHPFDQRALYIEFKERMRKQGIKPETDAFRNALKSDRYFNALQAKYGYAITCHKSQGGEWENAFVDFKVYIGKLSRSFFRWAYTAITRGSQQLLCIDAPQYNALSQFVVRDIEKISNAMAGAYYFPKKENEPLYFIQIRKERLKSICEVQEIALDIKEHNYQLEITFRQGENTGRVQLWFSTGGFTKTNWHPFNNEDFNNRVETILIQSLLPGEVPFSPAFEFQLGLHRYFLDLLQEENLPLTNIVQHQWSDQYFIYTGASCAMVEFFYNDKQLYTYARPRSTSGVEDTKLQAIVDRLRGN
jgi:tRNA A37 threonylcarbamoyladenosine biosynthesis protein TsaE